MIDPMSETGSRPLAEPCRCGSGAPAGACCNAMDACDCGSEEAAVNCCYEDYRREGEEGDEL